MEITMTDRRVLFTAKVDSHIKHFHLPFIKLFHDHGFKVDVASEGNEVFQNCYQKYNLTFGTNPFSKSVIRCYKELKNIIEQNDYEIIHTHTAIASVLTRLVAHQVNKKRKKKVRVIYTAHGFHFLKGGSKLSWLVYFPIECFFSRYTDDLILINQEDFDLANRFKMAKKRYLVKGVGIDLDFFIPKSREDHTLPYQITYVAEMSVNKNQILLIKAASILRDKGFNFHINLVGSGPNEQNLINFVKENRLETYVEFKGYRRDVKDILQESDLIVATSLREGLPINIIESMAMALPIIATPCRGHLDLIQDQVNGYIVDYDANKIAEKVEKLLNDKSLRKRISENNIIHAQNYGVNEILKVMEQIYGLKGDK